MHLPWNQKVKGQIRVMRLSNALLAWVCRSIWLLRFLVAVVSITTRPSCITPDRASTLEISGTNPTAHRSPCLRRRSLPLAPAVTRFFHAGCVALYCGAVRSRAAPHRTASGVNEPLGKPGYKGWEWKINWRSLFPPSLFHPFATSHSRSTFYCHPSPAASGPICM